MHTLKAVLGAALVVLTLTPAASALPYHEITQPQGNMRGVMFVIHGGSWQNVGQQQVERRRPDAGRWAAQGWLVYNIDYRAGANSITDVIDFYDHVRAQYPNERICAWGESAGGHLALMMAHHRPGVECVMTEAAPTNLTVTNGGSSLLWGPVVYLPAYSAFGPDMQAVSPRFLSISARQHISFAPNDLVIPAQSQGWGYGGGHPDATLRQVNTTCPCAQWIHGSVGKASLNALRGEQANFANNPPSGAPSGDEPEGSGGASSAPNPITRLIQRLLGGR